MEPLRVTETNSGGDESAGTVWGLRYELMWVGLGGVALSLLIVAILFATGNTTVFRAALAAGPAIVAIGVALFRQTHPPGYDLDLLDLWTRGTGFGPRPPFERLP